MNTLKRRIEAVEKKLGLCSEQEELIIIHHYVNPDGTELYEEILMEPREQWLTYKEQKARQENEPFDGTIIIQLDPLREFQARKAQEAKEK